MKEKLSIIIPVYNEEKVIENCLKSLARQDYPEFEVIVVDDGSTDSTVSSVQGPVSGNKDRQILILQQSHKGPGAARNLGASKATGEILVFVDGDMEFEPDFLTNLVAPILAREAIGTFSNEEYLLNKDNTWAKCWSLNMSGNPDSMAVGDMNKEGNRLYLLGKNIFQNFEKHEDQVEFSKDSGHVFRAIKKDKFDQAGGFDTKIGYTDDWSLARKLDTLAQAASGAKYYHRNPESLSEVWKQARWYGKNEFLTRTLIRKLYNLFRYFPPIGAAKGLLNSAKYSEPNFVIFKTIYDSAVWTSVLLSFFGEGKHK